MSCERGVDHLDHWGLMVRHYNALYTVSRYMWGVSDPLRLAILLALADEYRGLTL